MSSPENSQLSNDTNLGEPSPTVESKRIGEMYIKHIPEIRATYYKKVKQAVKPGGEEIVWTPFEMYIADEVREKIGKKGWKLVRQMIEEDLKEIDQDPYGSRSIDPETDRHHFPSRSINAISPFLEEQIGLKMAVKVHGVTRMSAEMHTQFPTMRKLAIDFDEKLPDSWKKVVRICPVYALLRWDSPTGIEQRILMERIDDAEQIESEYIYMSDSVMIPSFFAEDHPDLAKLAIGNEGNTELSRKIRLQLIDDGYIQKNNKEIDPNDIPREGVIFPGMLMPWRQLNSEFAKFGIKLSDLSGRNVLCQENDGNRTYTIIDQY